MEKNDLLITAAQAQLSLSSDEEERLIKAVSEMLNYFELMNEVDVENIKPTTHSLICKNTLRDDSLNKKRENLQQELIDAAPESEDNFIVIPSVL